jgi:hypothetical protein
MIDALVKWLLPILANKLPWLPEAMGYVVVSMVIVSPLIELVEAVTKLTASTADDELAAKIKSIRDKVLPILEVLPHANIPVAAWIATAADWIKRALAAIKK